MSGWVTNWFACTECGEPTDYRRKGEDGYYYGKCSKCGHMVRLFVDYDGRRKDVWATETRNSKKS